MSGRHLVSRQRGWKPGAVVAATALAFAPAVFVAHSADAAPVTPTTGPTHAAGSSSHRAASASAPTADATTSTTTAASAEPSRSPDAQPIRPRHAEVEALVPLPVAGAATSKAHRTPARTRPSAHPTRRAAAAATATPSATPRRRHGARLAGCSPSAVTDPMNVTVTNPANNTTAPATGVVPFGRLRLDFSGSVSGGHCAGDGFSFLLPSHLTIPSGTTFPLKAADGSTVANLKVTGRTVDVTLTSYVEDHDDVTLNGWFQAQMDNSVSPGETVDLQWNINGRTVNTPVTMKGCTGCSGRLNTLSKWGNYDAASGTITVNLSLPAATTDNQVFTFTDTLTSAGQEFACPVTATSQMFNSLNEWGNASKYVKGPVPTITSCSGTAITGTITLPKGYAAVVSFPEKVTDASQPSWSDTASVTTNGQTQTRSAQASAFSGGGGASGRVHPTPTPSATASGSATPIPTPSDTSSPSGSTSASGSATPSDSSTATASGSATSTTPGPSDSSTSPGATASGSATPIPTGTDSTTSPTTPTVTAKGEVTGTPTSTAGDGVPTATAKGESFPTTIPTDLDIPWSSITSEAARHGWSVGPNATVRHTGSAAPGTGARMLPRTGTEMAETVGAAVVLIGGGTTLMVASRRRRYDGTHR